MKKSIVLVVALAGLVAGNAQGMQATTQTMLNKAITSLEKAYKKASLYLGVDVSNASTDCFLKVSDNTPVPTIIKPGETKWVAMREGKSISITLSKYNKSTKSYELVLDANEKPLRTRFTRTSGNIAAYLITPSTAPRCVITNLKKLGEVKSEYKKGLTDPGSTSISGLCVGPIMAENLNIVTHQ